MWCCVISLHLEWKYSVWKTVSDQCWFFSTFNMKNIVYEKQNHALTRIFPKMALRYPENLSGPDLTVRNWSHWCSWSARLCWSNCEKIQWRLGAEHPVIATLYREGVQCEKPPTSRIYNSLPFALGFEIDNRQQGHDLDLYALVWGTGTERIKSRPFQVSHEGSPSSRKLQTSWIKLLYTN
jgi:hypothetical protein